MTKVKLEITKDRRRLHIGSFFTDLNETDYQELIRIFANENIVKNLSSNLPVISCACHEDDKHGETKIWCCNHCGLSVEDWWGKH